MLCPPRVLITVTARDLLRSLRDRHGPLMLHQSGGCCDGSAPMCYPDGEFLVGDRDVLLGVIDLTAEPGGADAGHPTAHDAVNMWISGPQFAAWRHTQLIVDVVTGRGGGFSLEAPEGVRLLTRSRAYTDAENAVLDDASLLTGADLDAGAVPSTAMTAVVIAHGAIPACACPPSVQP